MGIPSESFRLHNIVTMATSAASQNLTKLLYLPTQPFCPSGAMAGPTDDLICSNFLGISECTGQSLVVKPQFPHMFVSCSLSLVPGLVFIGQSRQEFTLQFLQSCIVLFCLAVS